LRPPSCAFFVPCSPRDRHLHSFPTRRSSDLGATAYKAMNPDAKAIFRAADYIPAHELPSTEYPLQLITGRTIYHFHTRTKTGRADRKSTRLNSSHVSISYAVFCLKKKRRKG